MALFETAQGAQEGPRSMETTQAAGSVGSAVGSAIGLGGSIISGVLDKRRDEEIRDQVNAYNDQLMNLYQQQLSQDESFAKQAHEQQLQSLNNAVESNRIVSGFNAALRQFERNSDKIKKAVDKRDFAKRANMQEEDYRNFKIDQWS